MNAVILTNPRAVLTRSQLILGTFVGTFILTNDPIYHWYLSSTAILLFISWSLHNVIAWLKNKPLLSRTASRWYIWTVVLVQPYWVVEIVFVVCTAFDVLTPHLCSRLMLVTVSVLHRSVKSVQSHAPLRSSLPRSLVDLYDREPVLEH
jgi:hypothetical protein